MELGWAGKRRNRYRIDAWTAGWIDPAIGA
jgi:hypothetical protein